MMDDQPEKIIHTTIKELAARIWEAYAIRIDEISIDWIDISTVGEKMMQVRCVDMRTRKYL